MTRATSNIGWIKYPIAMCLFLSISTLCSSPLLSDSLPPFEYKYNHPIPYKMVFETPVWGVSPNKSQETFCIFRNYATGTGLQDLNIAHYQGRFRWDAETRGAREWSDCRLMGHYRISLRSNLGVSVGLGISASRFVEALSTPAIPTPGPEFMGLHGFSPMAQFSGHWHNETAGDWVGCARISMSNASDVWNEAQCIWLPKGKQGSGRPYVKISSNPAQNTLEAGYIYSGSLLPNAFKTYTVILGLRTSEAPASLQIIKYWKSWSGGLKVYWHQQLGWQSAMQIKKSW